MTSTDLQFAVGAEGRGKLIDQAREVCGYRLEVGATRNPFNPADRDLTLLSNRARAVGTLSKDPLSE